MTLFLMKKLIPILLISVLTPIKAREIIKTDFTQLPPKVQNFLLQYYPENKVLITHIEKNNYRILSYSVALDNGCNISFEENGNWKEVECLREELSSKVVPKKIAEYIERNKIDDEIIRISRKRSYYIVELSKKNILIFDFKFNLLKRVKW